MDLPESEMEAVDYATAAQTLATREADCTNSRVVCTHGPIIRLPARIVFRPGLQCKHFGGLRGLEVYLGQWVALDPTFGPTL